MVIIEHLKAKDVPLLHVVKETVRNEPLPTVIYYHGFNGEKESSLTLAYKIAEKGLRVILPDAPLHGERNGYRDEPIEHGATFWNIVLKALDELDDVKRFLQANNYVAEGRIGLGGTSMGGMLTYAALAKYDWIKVAAVLMGTPHLTKRAQLTLDGASDEQNALLDKIAEVDISERIDALHGRPLFIWHGEKDQIVPVQDTRDFYAQLKEREHDDDKLVFIEEKDRIHNISKFSIKKTAEWFKAKL